MSDSKKQLTKDDILKIPEMRERMTDTQVAEALGCSRATIQRWIKRLKSLGVEVQVKKRGRPEIL